MTRDKLLKTIVLNLKKEGAKKIALFGSYARNEQRPQSDLDILVRFKSKKSYFDIVRIERELSQKAGVKIDLLTEKSINPLILNNIKKEMKVLCP